MSTRPPDSDILLSITQRIQRGCVRWFGVDAVYHLMGDDGWGGTRPVPNAPRYRLVTSRGVETTFLYYQTAMDAAIGYLSAVGAEFAYQSILPVQVTLSTSGDRSRLTRPEPPTPEEIEVTNSLAAALASGHPLSWFTESGRPAHVSRSVWKWDDEPEREYYRRSCSWNPNRERQHFCRDAQEGAMCFVDYVGLERARAALAVIRAHGPEWRNPEHCGYPIEQVPDEEDLPDVP